MGPQEKRLTTELAVYLVRGCSRALQSLPPGTTLDLAGRRRWFEQAYREWQLTPRVDLAGRPPYEVIAAEQAASRAAAPVPRPKSAVELYTDLATLDLDPSVAKGVDPASGRDERTGSARRESAEPSVRAAEGTESGGWQRLADRLFGSWLDDRLNRL